MPPTAVVIGEVMIELQSSADEPGVSHGSGESFGSGISHRIFAGDTLNCTAAIAAISTDISVRYLTGVGEGEQSSQLIDFCTSLRVDASGSMRMPDRHSACTGSKPATPSSGSDTNATSQLMVAELPL